MTGGGPFDLKAGEWTDDTSMALCLATSLVERGRFDVRDQMDRYCRWHAEGYLSSNGSCFDIGITTLRALQQYQSTDDPFSGPTAPNSAGNGSIMRLAPVALYSYPDREAALRYAADSSRTTHGAAECLDACRLLADVLLRALDGRNKQDVLRGSDPQEFASPAIAALARGDYLRKSESEIQGSGYVVRCLEAALWCFHHTDTFEEAILKAVNLGDDADTTAAVCGQIAGAYYGEAGIPARWLKKLAMGSEIGELAERLQNKHAE
jgi:ADP-ribosyl-[dinitrogen reductase] hydrolase